MLSPDQKPSDSKLIPIGAFLILLLASYVLLQTDTLKNKVRNLNPFIQSKELEPEALAQWLMNAKSGDDLPLDRGSCEKACRGKLISFADTSKQDALPDSGWTKAKRFEGDGALIFNGDNNYIEVTKSDQVKIEKYQTAEFWLMPASQDKGGQLLFWKDEESQFQLALTKDRELVAQIEDDQGNKTTKKTKTKLAPGLWHQVVAVKNEAEIILFINGALQETENTDSLSEPVDSSGAKIKGMYLGALPGADDKASYFYKGVMDAVSIYNQPLHQEEVSLLFDTWIEVYIEWSGDINLENVGDENGDQREPEEEPGDPGDGGGGGGGGGGGEEPGDGGGSGGGGDQENNSVNNADNRVDSGEASSGGKIFLGRAGALDDTHTLAPALRPPSDPDDKDESLPPSVCFYAGFDGDTSTIAHAFSPNGFTWIKENNEPLQRSNDTGSGGRIPLGEEGEPDDTFVGEPAIVFDPNINKHRMWYNCNDGHNSSICYAEANGNNLSEWTKKGVVLERDDNSQEDVHVASPFVLLGRKTTCEGEKDKQGPYDMWYSGFDGATWRIFRATSNDGNTWTKKGLVIDIQDSSSADVHVKGPTVAIDIKKMCPEDPYCCPGCCCKEVSRTYHMYYAGFDGATWRIYHATSGDGINWDEKGPILTTGFDGSANDTYVSEPSVYLRKYYTDSCCGDRCVEIGKLFHLQFEGSDGATSIVQKAISYDGYSFRAID